MYLHMYHFFFNIHLEFCWWIRFFISIFASGHGSVLISPQCFAEVLIFKIHTDGREIDVLLGAQKLFQRGLVHLAIVRAKQHADFTSGVRREGIIHVPGYARAPKQKLHNKVQIQLLFFSAFCSNITSVHLNKFMVGTRDSAREIYQTYTKHIPTITIEKPTRTELAYVYQTVSSKTKVHLIMIRFLTRVSHLTFLDVFIFDDNFNEHFLSQRHLWNMFSRSS